MQSRFLVHFDFPHRMNKNGTIDSICPHCYATIGTSTWEADLDRIEAAHRCEPSRRSYFDEHRRKPVVREQLPLRQERRVAQSSRRVESISERKPALHR